MTNVVACLLTYQRMDYAKKTIQAFYEHVQPKPPMHIADDGSAYDYIDRLVRVADEAGAPFVTWTNSERGGYGKNYNLATQVIHHHASYVLPLEDDWELTRPLLLNDLVDDFIALPDLECVRLGYLSFTQPIWGRVVSGAAPRHSKYLMFDPNSSEPHVWAGHPRLERVSYQKAVGEWPEGISPGETEFTVAHIKRARCGVAWPMDLVHPRGDLFAHIGTVRAW